MRRASASRPAPLFDRLRIEVIPPGDGSPCKDCTHEFDLDRRLVTEGRASVGLRPPVLASGYAARVRLFRSTFVRLGEPRPDATIDVTVSLPPIEAEGVVPVTVTLRTDDVGRPIGSAAAPVPPSIGGPHGVLPGTWRGAKRRDCGAAAAQTGEVCVPGGAFWMGNPRVVDSPLSPAVVRLVTLSPFFLDAAEVTVRKFRDSRLAKADDPFRPLPDTSDAKSACFYTGTPGPNDDLPVNCISWDQARAYCTARGGDLPTEAQFQYVASALTGKRNVWGDDVPTCDDAIFARFQIRARDYLCRGVGAAAPGSGLRDRLAMPSGTIVDLGGNVAEYALDVWNLSNEACWGAGVFVDPSCDESKATRHASVQHTIVGGSWTSSADSVAAATRHESGSYVAALADEGVDGRAALDIIATGFRCARPLPP